MVYQSLQNQMIYTNYCGSTYYTVPGKMVASPCQTLDIQNKALKIAWIQRLLNNPHSSQAKTATKSLPPGNIVKLSGNISTKDIISNKLIPSSCFWKDTVMVSMVRDVTKTKSRNL